MNSLSSESDKIEFFLRFGALEKKLKAIKKNNLLRRLDDTTVEKQYIIINKKKLLNFSSNDYLGIKPSKINYVQFQSSSRLVSGNDQSFSILEKKLSKHKSQEKTIIYPTGYMANLGGCFCASRKTRYNFQ